MKKGKPTPTLQLKVFSVSQKMIAPIPMIPKTKKKRRRMTEDVFRCTSPIEYFKLFMTDELVTLIVEQTDCAGLLKKIYERTKLTAEEFDREFNKTKRHEYGIKLFKLCSKGGYTQKVRIMDKLAEILSLMQGRMKQQEKTLQHMLKQRKDTDSFLRALEKMEARMSGANPAAAKHSIFDSLCRRKDRFNFDAENGRTYDIWYKRFKDVFDNDCS
nr:unnamed protein product [Haemonchus contortus]